MQTDLLLAIFTIAFIQGTLSKDQYNENDIIQLRPSLRNNGIYYFHKNGKESLDLGTKETQDIQPIRNEIRFEQRKKIESQGRRSESVGGILENDLIQPSKLNTRLKPVKRANRRRPADEWGPYDEKTEHGWGKDKHGHDTAFDEELNRRRRSDAKNTQRLNFINFMTILCVSMVRVILIL